MKNLEKVVVGFSGGVDSAMTVKILKKRGYEPVVVFLKVLKNQDLRSVRHLADKIGVKLVIKDISDIFSNCIIKDFLEEYQDNRTPNPCVLCNHEVKFKTLLEIADRMGIEKVATGHYAQIKEADGKFKLLKGVDDKKDQSYFLYRLTQKELSRIIFPLGDKKKQEISREALEEKLFDKIEESQDVCFLENQDKVQNFLKANLKSESGEIQDEKGDVLGEHQGLVYYTQGQRKGLDLPGGPFYVIGKKVSENVLVVSKNKEHEKLVNRQIYLEDVNWIAGNPDSGKFYEVKSRYRAGLTLGKILKEDEVWKIVLDEPQWAVAAGQSAVVYKGEEVIGGGTISIVN